MKYILNVWARLLAPFAPHVAEEIWETIGEGGFVSLAPWPSHEEIPEYREADISYKILSNIIEDVKSISSSGISGSNLYIYVASPWKYELFRRIEELKPEIGLNSRRLIPELMKDPAFRERGSYVPEIVKQLSSGGWPWLPDRDKELSAIETAKNYLERKLGMKVRVDLEESPSYDPKKRASRALPGRPAIYIE
jgi:leucyl-tRNA synthetase